MESMSSKSSISFYYGYGNLSKLREFERVVLQPSHYSQQDILELNRTTETYAYISLGEDSTSDGPWKLAEHNPDWGGSYVDLSSKMWHDNVLMQVEAYFEMGFQGIFMDTLDAIDIYPEQRENMLKLLERLKALAKDRPLMANRGFGLMPELQNYIDSIVFEAFSCTWTEAGSARKLTPNELLWTKRIANELKGYGLKIYALDYAENPKLISFAAERAKEFGFEAVISNRNLTLI